MVVKVLSYELVLRDKYRLARETVAAPAPPGSDDDQVDESVKNQSM